MTLSSIFRTSSYKRAIVPIFLLLGTAFAAEARQALDEAVLCGTVYLGGKMVEYRLHVVYAVTAWRGMSDIDRRIQSITLMLGKREIIFPRKAYNDLYTTAAPSAIYEHGLFNTQGGFTIVGGDGEKSYEVAFNFNKNRLLSRELYRHMERKPEVIHFH